MAVMGIIEHRPGLWRWTAPHPGWTPEKERPGGWGQMVGCVYYETQSAADRAIVLIDPLAPPAGSPDADRFWKALDADVERSGAAVTILLGNHHHERGAGEFSARFRARAGASIWAHEAVRGRVRCDVTRTFAKESELTAGVRAYPIIGLEPTETAYWIPEHRALVFADALIGAGQGRVRVAPVSWGTETPEGNALYEREFRASMRRLIDLGPELLLVSHGEPVTQGARALAERGWLAADWPASARRRDRFWSGSAGSACPPGVGAPEALE